MPPRQEQKPNDQSFRERSRSMRSATYVRRSSTGAPIDIVGKAKPTPEIKRVPAPKTTPVSAANIPPGVSMKDVIGPSVKKVESKKAKPALPRQSRSQVLHRSTFGPKVARKTRAKIKRRSRRVMPSPLTVMASILFIVGIGVSFSVWRNNNDVKAQVEVLAKNTQNSDSDLPDETEPDEASFSNYQVGHDLPRYLKINKIKVNARVIRLGVKSDNELKAPGNVFDVGWYEGSSKPGENGTIVLDGHVSGPTKRGVFYSLGSLRANDKISIERGDGKVFNYTVVKTQLFDYDKVDMSAILTSSIPGKPGLNLITCSGRFDVRTNKYEERLIVFAVQE